MTYSKVVGRVAKVFTEDEIREIWRRVDDARMRTFLIERDRREMLGKTFVFEQLECGHLGECLGVAGSGAMRDPAAKRRCEH